jgi:hypothetical protein
MDREQGAADRGPRSRFEDAQSRIESLGHDLKPRLGGGEGEEQGSHDWERQRSDRPTAVLGPTGSGGAQTIHARVRVRDQES